MKHEKELKDHKTTIRLSEKQYQTFCLRGEKAGMSWVNYMLSRAMQADGLTPELMVRITNLVNIAVGTVRDYAPDKASFMQKEVDAIWSILK